MQPIILYAQPALISSLQELFKSFMLTENYSVFLCNQIPAFSFAFLYQTYQDFPKIKMK